MTTMTLAEAKRERKAQKLADRRAYRQTLINRQEETERKIKAVDEQIRKLREG